MAAPKIEAILTVTDTAANATQAITLANAIQENITSKKDEIQTAAGATNYDFSGKLSYSWPAKLSLDPLNRNDANYEPLFPYGFGLSYQDTDTLGDDLDESGNGGVVVPVTLPGTVEAELYASSFGIQLEPTNDIGGGSNIGYTNPGDWLEYTIDVPSAGDYLIEYRVASQTGSTGFQVLLDGVLVDTQAVPNTGGWQIWQNNSATVSLQAGAQTLRINSVGSNWNLNWISFTSL